MTRAVPEWIGKNDDAKVPPRVRERVADSYGRKCYLTGVALVGNNWDLDHIVALANGGKHRESNLAPATRAAHQRKTEADQKIKAKIAAASKKHLGIKGKPTALAGRTQSEKHEARKAFAKQPSAGISEIARRFGLA